MVAVAYGACQQVGYYYLLFLWGMRRESPNYDTRGKCGKEGCFSMWVKLLLIIHDGTGRKYMHECASTGWCVWLRGEILTRLDDSPI